MNRRTALGALALLGLASAVPVHGTAQAVPGISNEEHGAEIRRYRSEALTAANATLGEWQTAWARDDLRALTSFYASDALLLLPGDVEPVQGRAAIEGRLGEYLPGSGAVHLALHDGAVGGSLVYVYGKFYAATTAGAGGDAFSKGGSGTYTAIIQQSGREWRIRAQFFRTDPEPEAGARAAGAEESVSALPGSR